MKKLKFDFMMLFSVSVVILCLIFLAVFFLQMKDNGELKQVVNAKSQELKEAQAMNKRLEKLENRRQEISYREQALTKMVPRGESKPFSLVKELVKVGMELGLKDTEFLIKEKKKTDDADTPAAATAPKVEEEDLPQGVKAVYLEVKCKATFSQLLKLLDRIHAFKRITEIEEIEVKRSDKIIPYQRVRLELVAYTFIGE